MTKLTPMNNIANLHPYKPGLPIEQVARMYNLDPGNIIKLASNENPLGQSPKALKVIQGATDAISRYPDQHLLISALAQFYNVDQANIIIGNGSNDILDLIARVFLSSDFDSISSEYGFIVYRLVTQIVGAKNIIVPASDYGHDLDAIFDAITEKTKVIWVANPNNPTGTFITYSKVKDFIARIPADIVVVLDEAYYEYLDQADRVDTTKWIDKFQNLVLVRTFSKIYGLAGLRLGYGISSPEIIELLNRVRQPFNVNNLAIDASVAALSDMEFVESSRSQNQKGIQQLVDGFDNIGVSYIKPYGNFITVKVNNSEKVYDYLLKKGVIVRQIKEYGLADHLRISVGTEKENRFLLELWAELTADSAG